MFSIFKYDENNRLLQFFAYLFFFVSQLTGKVMGKRIVNGQLSLFNNWNLVNVENGSLA